MSESTKRHFVPFGDLDRKDYHFYSQTPNDMETEILTPETPKVQRTFEISPKQTAIRDMRAESLDTTVLELRKTVIVDEIEEFVFCSIDDGITPRIAPRFLKCIGRRVKRTIISETTRI